MSISHVVFALGPGDVAKSLRLLLVGRRPSWLLIAFGKDVLALASLTWGIWHFEIKHPGEGFSMIQVWQFPQGTADRGD
jgi:hypothetical protein